MNRSKRRDTPRNPIALQWANLQNDQLVSLRQAANAVSVSTWTLRRLIKEGKVRAVRVAWRLKVRQSEVLRLIKVYEGKIDYAQTLPGVRERVSAGIESENP